VGKTEKTKQNIVTQQSPPNAILGLIKVTCYLLDRQIRRLERDFFAEGGIREA